MGLAITSLIILGVLGIITIISGEKARRNDDSVGIVGTIFGSLIIALVIVCMIAAIAGNRERTQKIVGKGVITKSDDIDYVDGGGISSDKITFYYLLKNGDKIVVDKTEWESGNIEFTYKVTEVERVKE